MKRIIKISRVLQIIFSLFLIVVPLISIYCWFFSPLNYDVSHGFHSRFLSANLSAEFIPKDSLDIRFYGWLVNLIPLSLEMFVLYCLKELFKLYEKGKIFTASNVKYIRYIGITFLIEIIVQPFHEALTSLVLSYHNPHGKHLIILNFTDHDINKILTAIIILLVSWVMTEACKLQEEQVLTI